MQSPSQPARKAVSTADARGGLPYDGSMDCPLNSNQSVPEQRKGPDWPTHLPLPPSEGNGGAGCQPHAGTNEAGGQAMQDRGQQQQGSQYNMVSPFSVANTAHYAE